MDSNTPRDRLRLSGTDPLAPLAGWLAEGRVDAAASARARQRWLERQLAEDATLAGVLLDLAERGRPVTVRTIGGRASRGSLVAVGADFVAVREPRLGDVLIPTAAIATIRPAPGEQTTVGDRPGVYGVMFGEALVELAADRPLVLVSAAGDDARGELRTAGRDLVSIATTGKPRDTVHVRLAAIDHLVILAR